MENHTIQEILIKTLRPIQNVHLFGDVIFKHIF